MSLVEKFSSEVQLIEAYLQTLFTEEGFSESTKELREAIRYSLLSGGKRFRPLLSLLTARTLGQDLNSVLPLAASVEMIHTYSLIHDDLPCMDNDELRRGQPANHIKYGEDIALLAGDALLTESFLHMTESYVHQPELAVVLCSQLAKAAGAKGMIAGQIIDIKALKGKEITGATLKELHKLKTGELIRISIEAAAMVSGATKDQQKNFKCFGENLGFAFQLADDILDYDPKAPEKSGFPYLMGLEETKKQLNDTTQKALEAIKNWPNSPLKEIAKFNQLRSN